MGFEFLLPWTYSFISYFSYLGVFIVSVISSSTLFLPFPLYLVIFLASGLGLNPFLTGIISGVGSALGELSGYFVGAGGRYIVEEKKRKRSKVIKSLANFFERFGFVTIVIAALLPFPFDFIGILSGASAYNIKKFLLATIIGKSIKTLLIAYLGFLIVPYVGLFA